MLAQQQGDSGTDGGGALHPAGGFRDIFFTSRDGLRLHARCYGPPNPELRPVVCLPGLTRNARDFHQLASALSAPGPARRQVFCPDYRGRGLSQWDTDWRNYTPAVEANDVLDLLTLLGLKDVACVGTSRGGIIAMLIAVQRPRAIGALVLNDIGPVIEPMGLMRIASYVGRAPLPASWDEARETVKSQSRGQFPALKDHEWAAIARCLYEDLAGVPGFACDPQLGNSMRTAMRRGRMPELWPQFKSLTSRPVLVLRGEHSDILSEATVRRMHELHPMLDAVTIAGQGHAPFLHDGDSQALIARFFARCEVKTTEAVRSPFRAVA